MVNRLRTTKGEVIKIIVFRTMSMELRKDKNTTVK